MAMVKKIDGHNFNVQLSQIGLDHLSTVIIKHCNLDHFVELNHHVEEAMKAKSAGDVDRIGSCVNSAVAHLECLTSSQFFLVYPKFGPILRTFQSDFSHYLHSKSRHKKLAIEQFFMKFYGNNSQSSTIVVKFEDKLRSRIQGGFVATVSRNANVLGRYHAKVHLGIAVYPFNENADMRELFSYKLLELLKLGPKVYFVPNVHNFPLGLYVVTEEVSGFVQADEVDVSEDQMSKLELIRRILCLKDLHSANYGLDCNRNLKIIDFKVSKKYGKAENYWTSGTKVERQRVARSCLNTWQLETKIAEAKESIYQEKTTLERNGIPWKPMSDFETYLTEVQKNIGFILSTL